jgi:hypothetical protein
LDASGGIQLAGRGLLAQQEVFDLRQIRTFLAVATGCVMLACGGAAAAPAQHAPTPGTTTAVPPEFAGIGQPFTAAQLAIINKEPLSYYQQAGDMLLQKQLANPFKLGSALSYQPYVVNGKPSVILIEAISCDDCGQSRWQNALALATFGSFSGLYKGYASTGDFHVATLYWGKDDYTVTESATFGSAYTSKYINLYAVDGDSPVIDAKAHFVPISYFVDHAPDAGWRAAMQFMDNANNAVAGGKAKNSVFQSWGSFIWNGSDAKVFGNSPPTPLNNIGTLPLANENQDAVLAELKKPQSQFAWSEYAAADIYIATVCKSFASATAAPPVCALPAIVTLESQVSKS